MNRTAVATLAILATLGLAGCTSTSSSASPASAVPPSPSDLATRIGCTDYSPTVPPTLYAREEGGCTLGDDDLDIVTFSDRTAQDNWVKVGSQFGGIILKGNLWVVATGSHASADAVKGKIGGTT
jgi:hypothetical protein